MLLTHTKALFKDSDLHFQLKPGNHAVNMNKNCNTESYNQFSKFPLVGNGLCEFALGPNWEKTSNLQNLPWNKNSKIWFYLTDLKKC